MKLIEPKIHKLCIGIAVGIYILSVLIAIIALSDILPLDFATRTGIGVLILFFSMIFTCLHDAYKTESIFSIIAWLMFLCASLVLIKSVIT